MFPTTPKTHLSHTATSEYYRSTLKVTKQLRWLQLAEIEYCRVSNLPTNPDDTNNVDGGGVGLRPRTFGKWEVVQRTTPSSSSAKNISDDHSPSTPTQHHQASSVEVLCIVKDHRGAGVTTTPATTPSTYVVLVSQYRPPIDAISLEFPAGLVDTEDGSPAVTAAREMKEETGYEVTIPRRFLPGASEKGVDDYDADACVESVSGTPMSYDPGLTDSLFHLVEMKVHLRQHTQHQSERNTPPDDVDDTTTKRMMSNNCNPIPELDGEEDIQVHLLPLDMDQSCSVGERLEQLRLRLGARTVVTGKVHTFAMGIDLARSMSL